MSTANTVVRALSHRASKSVRPTSSSTPSMHVRVRRTGARHGAMPTAAVGTYQGPAGESSDTTSRATAQRHHTSGPARLLLAKARPRPRPRSRQRHARCVRARAARKAAERKRERALCCHRATVQEASTTYILISRLSAPLATCDNDTIQEIRRSFQETAS